MVIDASDTPLGRLASEVVKLLKRGERVVVVNARRIVISGTMEDAYAKWKRRLDLRSLGNPRIHTPKYPRTVVGIVKRAIRGMVNRRSPPGRKMLKRVRVYSDIPEEYRGKEVRLKIQLPTRYVYLEELVTKLGGRV